MALSGARKELSRPKPPIGGVTLPPHLVPTQPRMGRPFRPYAVRAVSKRILLMDHRLVFAPARPAARAFAVAAATTMLTALIGSGAFAQAPPPATPAPKAAPKPAPK